MNTPSPASRYGLPQAKRCIVCHEVKPLEAFHINRTRPDCRQNVCRQCRRTYRTPVPATRSYSPPSLPPDLPGAPADPAAEEARLQALSDMEAEFRTSNIHHQPRP